MPKTPQKGKIYLVYEHGGFGMTKKLYDNGFISRVRVARESAGLSRDEAAKHLGLKTDSYTRYELRTMMPHHLIPAFCLMTDVSLAYLLGATTGKKASQLRSV